MDINNTTHTAKRQVLAHNTVHAGEYSALPWGSPGRVQQLIKKTHTHFFHASSLGLRDLLCGWPGNRPQVIIITLLIAFGTRLLVECRVRKWVCVPVPALCACSQLTHKPVPGSSTASPLWGAAAQAPDLTYSFSNSRLLFLSTETTPLD
jgi:hypothetical protein